MPSSTSSADEPSGSFQALPPGQSTQYQMSGGYTATGAASISTQRPSLGSSHTPGGVQLPGSLQPGLSSRPGPSSVNTAPSGVPTISQLSTQQPSQYPTTSRPSISGQSHSHSRSSPAGFEGERYLSYASTPDASKYASPPMPKYTPIQNQGAASHSPLGLADIRPRADSSMSEDPLSANPYSNDGILSAPSNSCHLAPWALYAFDWCKWSVTQPSGAGAGKVAVGSYLEDGHNFVGSHRLRTKILSLTEGEGLFRSAWSSANS